MFSKPEDVEPCFFCRSGDGDGRLNAFMLRGGAPSDGLDRDVRDAEDADLHGVLRCYFRWSAR